MRLHQTALIDGHTSDLIVGILIIAVGALIVAAARWVSKAVAHEIANLIASDLGIVEMQDTINRQLNPPHESWPNGSETLPESVSEIWRRIDEVQRTVEQIEARC